MTAQAGRPSAARKWGMTNGVAIGNPSGKIRLVMRVEAYVQPAP